jgi:SAM-dependent methyltransferase
MDDIMLVFFILIGIGVISVLWSGFFGAPWVPTPMESVHKMLRLAEIKPDDTIYDLGCGDGRLIVTAATQYKAKGVGIEVDPLRYLYCQLVITLLGLRDQVKIVYGNFFNMDLSQADVVTCYLLPDTNKKLEEKLLRELSPGTRVISYTFLFDNVREVKKDGKARLYIFSPENTLLESIKKQLESSSSERPNGKTQ